jgi:dTDP-4-amino-4,6-dideoxygalactose transaminase
MIPAQVRSIPFFDYPSVFTAEEDQLTRIFVDVGRRGAFILQEDLVRFERELAAFLGTGYALGVGNATEGLTIALRAAGIGAGDQVIFSSHTMVATAAAIHFAGATPVPVECGDDHLIDPVAVADAVGPRTRAVLVTQLNGRMADMDAIGEIVRQRGLLLIEDAAQALGARFCGRSAGTFGSAGVFSFYPAKTLGCLGDGGAVVTGDGAIAGHVQELRDHGRVSRENAPENTAGEIAAWGLNSRLDNLQAAILGYRLERYPRAIERRRAIAGQYGKGLADLEELRLPPGPAEDPRHFDVFQNYEIEAASRDGLRDFLRRRGIGTILPWGGKAVHQWEGLGFRVKLPRTETLFERLLLLPLNLSLSDDDIGYIVDSVRAFYRQRRR